MGCSITGCLIFNGHADSARLRAIEGRLRSIIVKAEDRGRDSYGIVVLEGDGSIRQYKRIGRPSESISKIEQFVSDKTTIVINNNRAEPTTEYVLKKSSEDIQPFGNAVYVAHNGIIANDTELRRSYDLEVETKIDTAVLPPLLERLWDGQPSTLQWILRDVVLGSFALAIVDRRNPARLHLACNYKPIFHEYDPKLDAFFFTSLEGYLRDDHLALWESLPSSRQQPYTLCILDTSKSWHMLSLYPQHHAKKRALVICSGGLDSTVAAKLMVDRGYETSLLHFKYRHRAEEREAEHVARIGESFGSSCMFVDTRIFKDVIGHSRLTDTGAGLVIDREGEASAEFAHEWVPARNLIFLSIATGIAEAYGYDAVVLGNNLEEAGAYPDNEMEFVNRFNDLLPFAVNYQKRVRVEMPVGNLMKHEIVKLGIEIGAPLELTWSCYNGGARSCGTCGPDFMRRWGFKISGFRDPIPYDKDPQEEELFWHGCKEYPLKRLTQH